MIPPCHRLPPPPGIWMSSLTLCSELSSFTSSASGFSLTLVELSLGSVTSFPSAFFFPGLAGVELPSLPKALVLLPTSAGFSLCLHPSVPFLLDSQRPEPCRSGSPHIHASSHLCLSRCLLNSSCLQSTHFHSLPHSQAFDVPLNSTEESEAM